MRQLIWAVVGILFVSNGPAAADHSFPSVSFTGEAKQCTTINANEICSKMAIYYTPARFRVELGDAAERQAVLYDVAKKTVTTIDFAEKTYTIEMVDPKSDQLTIGFLLGRVDHARVGGEPVNGVPTLKYQVSAKADGLHTDGIVWVGADNIVRRMELTTTGVPNVAKVVSRFDVTKLVIGPVDPSLLDVAIPSDFTKADP